MATLPGVAKSFMSDEDKFQFVDTNILVYAYDRTAGHKFTIANQLLQQLWRNQNGCISIQVLQEFTYTITRKVKVPLSDAVTKSVVIEYAKWRVFSPKVEDLCMAIDIQQRYQLAFWDALIVHSAASLSCEILWSEDLNSGQQFADLEVRNPFLT